MNNIFFKHLTDFLTDKNKNVCFLHSGAGYGKNFYLNKLLKYNAENNIGYTFLFGWATRYSIVSLFKPVYRILYSLFNIKINDSYNTIKNKSLTELEKIENLSDSEKKCFIEFFLFKETLIKKTDIFEKNQSNTLCNISEIYIILEKILNHYSKNTKIVYVFKLMDFCDCATSRFVEKLLSSKKNKNIFKLIFLFSRPRFNSKKNNFFNIYNKFSKEKYVTDILLTRFDNEKISDYIQKNTNLQVVQKLVDNIYNLTLGIPFFVETTVDYINKYNENNELELPGTIHELLNLHIDSLSEDEKFILSFASVYGISFIIEDLSELIGENIDNPEQKIAGFVNKKYLKVTPAKKYKFSSHFFQELCYNKLSDEYKKYYHLLIAEQIKQKYDAALPGNIERLTYHYLRSSNKKRGIDYTLQYGKILEKLNAIEDKIKLFKNVADIIINDELNDETILAHLLPLLIQLGNDLINNYQYDNANKYLFEAYEIAKENNAKQQQCFILTRLARIFEFENSWEQVLGYAYKCLSIAEQINYTVGIEIIYQTLARVAERKRKFKEAEEFYFKGLATAEATENRLGITRFYSALARLYIKLKNLDKAKEFSLKSLEYQNTDSDLSIGYETLGNIELLKNNYDEAEKYFKQALTLDKKRNSITGMAINSYRLAQVNLKKENYDETINYYLQNLEYNSKTKHVIGKINTYIGLAEVYLILDEINKCIEYNDAAYKWSQSLPFREGTINCLQIKIRLALKNDNYKKADMYLSQAFDKLEDNDNEELKTKLELLKKQMLDK